MIPFHSRLTSDVPPSAGGKVMLNEYGTPITVPEPTTVPTPNKPAPPLQGPAPPPSEFANDEYGDQILNFDKQPSTSMDDNDCKCLDDIMIT